MVLLILVHGFFVAGEFGVVSVDRSKVEQRADEGDRRARSTLAALKTLSFQLSGAQLGITVTSLLVGFLIEPTVAPSLQPVLSLVGLPERTTLGVSVGLGLVLATSFEMVVAELIPKNLAIARPEAVAYRTATPLRVLNGAARPLILFLNASANWTVRLLGIQPQDELSSTHSLEELQVLIRSSREVGALSEEDFLLLARSMGFGDKRAEDALIPRTAITAVHKDQTLEDILEEIVGEIEDEYDPDEGGARLTRTPEGVYTVSGMLRRDELREQTGFELPEGDFETLAGFLLSLFDRVPSQGEHVSFQGWEFKVVEMDRNRIARVLLVAPSEPNREAGGEQ